MKQYTFLYENVDNKKDNTNEKIREEERKELANGIGVGVGGLVGLSATPLAAAPATRYMASDYKDLSNLDYLNGVKIKGQNYQDYLNKNNLSVTNYERRGSYFHPFNKTINMGLNHKGSSKIGKSIFAHELGHSLSMGTNNAKVAAYGLSKTCSSLAVWAQLINCFNNDDESRKKIGKAINIAGGVSSLPMVIEEINASLIGSQALGLRGMDRAKAFIGVGSYIAMALSPTIMYCVSEATRKFIKSLRKIKKEDPKAEQKINDLKKQNIKVVIKNN